MISRRPKSLASSENAPGPSKMIAIEKIMKRAATKFGSVDCKEKKIEIALPKKTRKAESGVKNPSNSAVPTTIFPNPKTCVQINAFPRSNRQNPPCIITVMLSVARSNSKPKPAAPSGNLEKNLCNFVSPVFVDRFQRCTHTE